MGMSSRYSTLLPTGADANLEYDGGLISPSRLQAYLLPPSVTLSPDKALGISCQPARYGLWPQQAQGQDWAPKNFSRKGPGLEGDATGTLRGHPVQRGPWGVGHAVLLRKITVRWA